MGALHFATEGCFRVTSPFFSCLNEAVHSPPERGKDLLALEGEGESKTR